MSTTRDELPFQAGSRKLLGLGSDSSEFQQPSVINSVAGFFTFTSSSLTHRPSGGKLSPMAQMSAQTTSARTQPAPLSKDPAGLSSVGLRTNTGYSRTDISAASTTAATNMQPRAGTIKPQFRGFDMNYDPWTGIRTAVLLGSMLILLTVYIIYKARCSKSSLTDADIAYYEHYRKRIDARKLMQARIARAAARLQKQTVVVDIKDANINHQPIVFRPVSNELHAIPPNGERPEQLYATAQWVHNQPLYTAIPAQPIEVTVDINQHQTAGAAATRRCSSEEFITGDNHKGEGRKFFAPCDEKGVLLAPCLDDRRPSSSVNCNCDDARCKQVSRPPGPQPKRQKQPGYTVNMIEDPFLASSLKNKASASFPQIKPVTTNPKAGRGKGYHKCNHDEGDYTMHHLPHSRLAPLDHHEQHRPSVSSRYTGSEWDESVQDLPPLLAPMDRRDGPSTSNTYNSDLTMASHHSVPYQNKAVIFYIDSDCVSTSRSQRSSCTDPNAQIISNNTSRDTSRRSSSSVGGIVGNKSESDSDVGVTTTTFIANNQSTTSSNSNVYCSSTASSSHHSPNLKRVANNSNGMRGIKRNTSSSSDTSGNKSNNKKITPPNSLALNPTTRYCPEEYSTLRLPKPPSSPHPPPPPPSFISSNTASISNANIEGNDKPTTCTTML